MRGLWAWLRARWPSVKHYWTQTGVIPRWQLVAVYALVVGVGVAGFVSVKDSRREAIVRTCHEQNARHDGTIRQLDAVIGTLPEGRRKEHAARNRPGTVLLIEALAPRVKDCEARARRLVPGWP